LADVVLGTVIVGDAFVRGVTGDDDTLTAGVTCEVFTGIDAVCSTEAFVWAFAGEGETEVLDIANEVFAGVAFVTLLTFVGGFSIDDDAEVRDTLEVFSGFETISVGRAFIRSSSVYGDAGVALADVMLLAVIVGDAFIGGVSLDDDALELRRAFEVFSGIETVLPTETFIIPFAGEGDADVLGVTDEVFSGVAFIARDAFIISCSSDDGAEVIHAGEVLVGFETVGIGGAGIVTGSIDGDTGVALADVVLLAVIVGDAFVIGISGDDDTGG
jgi:hypothetical protein